MEQLDNTQQTLSYVTVAYAMMFYAAATILLAGLVIKVTRYVRQHPRLRTRAYPSSESRMVTTLRAASDIAFFRGTFFTDRVQWIFSACFHFGLLLVLLRHLRYALDPAWVGPILWKGGRWPSRSGI